jgi:hypothetical protein
MRPWVPAPISTLWKTCRLAFAEQVDEPKQLAIWQDEADTAANGD